MRINTDQPFVPGFGRFGLRQVLFHELGHLAGLDHVPDPDQVMEPTTGRLDRSGYGAGDETGLVALGAWQGCIAWSGGRAGAAVGTGGSGAGDLVVRPDVVADRGVVPYCALAA